MVNCLIIDDENAAIDVLIHHINKVDYLNLTGYTTNPIKGLKLINTKKIDILFLDIRMPELNGIDFMKTIQGRCKIILTTAFPQYAIDGFEYDVIDYLLKPIEFNRFLKAIQKAQLTLNEGNSNAMVEEDHIYVKTDTKGKLVKIYFAEIVYIESKGNYLIFHQEDKKTTILMSLKDLEERLPKSNFIRIHRSYIICIDKITSIENNHAILRNANIAIPFGDSYRSVFFDMIKRRTI